MSNKTVQVHNGGVLQSSSFATLKKKSIKQIYFLSFYKNMLWKIRCSGKKF